MILSNLILLPVFMQRWVNTVVIFLKWYLKIECMIVFDRVNLYID
jgi:hypothetical protein